MRLEAKLIQEAARLVIDYRLHNPRDRAVYAYDLLQRIAPSGVAAPGPTLAYAMMGGPAQATIGKFLVPIPRGMGVDVPEMPLLARIEPGGWHQGRAVLALPLSRSVAYAASGGALPPRQISRLRFMVGFLDSTRVTEIELLPAPLEGFFGCAYATAIEQQEFVEQGFELALPGVQGKF